MEKIKSSLSLSHRLFLAIIAGIFAIALTCAPTQEAQAGGFEIGAGLGWTGCVNHHSDDHGFSLIIAPGYRILDWVGVYVDQGFGGLWNTKLDDSGRFFGQTIFNAKFFLPLNLPVDLWLKAGIGAAYVARDDWSDGAFGFKLGIGCTYNISDKIGVGANFDYLLSAWDGSNGHFLDLQIHLRYAF